MTRPTHASRHRTLHRGHTTYLQHYHRAGRQRAGCSQHESFADRSSRQSAVSKSFLLISRAIRSLAGSCQLFRGRLAGVQTTVARFCPYPGVQHFGGVLGGRVARIVFSRASMVVGLQPKEFRLMGFKLTTVELSQVLMTATNGEFSSSCAPSPSRTFRQRDYFPQAQAGVYLRGRRSFFRKRFRDAIWNIWYQSICVTSVCSSSIWRRTISPKFWTRAALPR